MVDFILRQGDELPRIERTFTTDGSAIDLTGASGVEFAIYDIATDAQVWKHNAVISNAVGGVVYYAFTTTDSGALAPGFYKGMFIATFGTLSMQAPNTGFISIQVTSLAEGAATYTGDPAARPIDAVRFLSQDTDTSSARISDTEILWLLTEHANDIYEAAASACETSAAKFAGYRDKTVGPLSIRYGEQFGRLNELAKTIRKRKSKITGFAPINTQSDDNHIFRIGMHDMYGDETDLIGSKEPS